MTQKPSINQPEVPISPKAQTMTLQNQKLMEATYEVIYGLNEDLEKLSKENMALKKKVTDLEKRLDSISKGMDENISTTTAFNNQMEASNDEIAAEIQKRNHLIALISPLLDRSLETHPDIFNENEDLASLLNTIRNTKRSPKPLLDPFLSNSLPNLEYFRDVKTNREFIQRCALIIGEVRRLEQSETVKMSETEYQKSHLAVLRKQLKRIQNDKDDLSADYSQQLTELSNEKQRLLAERQKLIDSQMCSRGFEERTLTPKRSIRMSRAKTVVLSPYYSPIRKKNVVSSPMKF